MSARGCILLVEDNEDDVFFMRRAMKSAGITNPVYVAENGQVAIDYLEGVGAFANRDEHPLPFLVFLDLKMPKKSGLDVLAWIRKQPALQGTVVLILTTSREESDVQRAYSLGVNTFLVKPPNALLLNELLKLIKAFWLDNPQLALATQTTAPRSS